MISTSPHSKRPRCGGTRNRENCMTKMSCQFAVRKASDQNRACKTPREFIALFPVGLVIIVIGFLSACGGVGENGNSPVITSFQASAESIVEGDSVELTAIFSNGSGSIDKGVGAVASGLPETIAPTETTVYTLTVTNNELVQITLKLTVTVEPNVVVPAPEIVSFESSSATLVEGDSAELTAIFSNGSGSIDNGIGAVASGESKTISPTQTTSFTLTVTSSEGVEETRTVTVTVEPRFAARPEITTFEASDMNTVEGERVELTAVFGNGIGSIDNGIGTVASGEPTIVFPEETTIYTLTVANSEGVKVTGTVTIAVEPHPIALTIVSPTPNQIFDSALRVVATKRRPSDKDTVTATLCGISTPLRWNLEAACEGDSFDSCIEGFEGEVPQCELPPGDHVLTVTVVDENGRSVSNRRKVRLDKKPVLTIEPLDLTVATPEIPLNISCVDDVSDCEITIRLEGDTLASAVGSLYETLDLSAYDGERVLVYIAANDGVNPTVQHYRTIFVEASKALEEKKGFNGQVVDFDGQQALVHISDASGDKLGIHDVESDASAVVEVPAGFSVRPRHSYLTPTGAIYWARAKDDYYDSALYDWNNTVLHDLGDISRTTLTVVGGYASWSDSSNLWLRHFPTETNVPIANSTDGSTPVLFENGTVVYDSFSPTRAIKKYESGIETTLIASNEIYGDNNLAADGDRVVFVRQKESGPSTHAIAYHDGSGEKILAEFSDFKPSHGPSFQIKGGWVAFTRLDSSGQRQIWTMDPSGALAQRTFFESHSSIDALSADGEVMLVNSERRYLSDPTGALKEVSSASASASSTKIDGVWYLYLGRSLFSVK